MALGRSLSTKVVNLKIENQRGEPRIFTGKATFDRPVQAYWVAVVGSDIKFQGKTEKYINRQLFSVDPVRQADRWNRVGSLRQTRHP